MTQQQVKGWALSETISRKHRITPEVGVPLEAMLSPKYWAHISAKFTIGDIIEVYPPDGAYYGELLVQDRGHLFAKVAVIRYVDLAEVKVKVGDTDNSVLAGFSVDWKGPLRKFEVTRLADKASLKSGMQTRGEAEAWLAQHVQTIAPRAA
jgi:hypothetical protein